MILEGRTTTPTRRLAAADLFVLPSRYEGFPNALLEAMAMGLPVVAADCDSGPREIIRDGVDGILVPPEDPEALSRAMLMLIRDHELRRRLGGAAVSVRERFSLPAVVRSWEEVLGIS